MITEFAFLNLLIGKLIAKKMNINKFYAKKD